MTEPYKRVIKEGKNPPPSSIRPTPPPSPPSSDRPMPHLTGEARLFVGLLQSWGVNCMTGVVDAIWECQDTVDSVVVNFTDGTSVGVKLSAFPFKKIT